MLLTILSALFALCLLIAIHEFGHFWMARRCGVKVLRFSIGFGSPLLRFKDKKGTEFVIAMLPLGGYVKMLDEREAPVDPDEQSFTFNRKSVFQRMLIIAAGPAINLLAAVIIFWVLAIAGQTVILPIVGEVSENSLAAESGIEPGDEIIAINDRVIQSWSDVHTVLAEYLGETATLTFKIKSHEIVDGRINLSQHTKNISIVIHDWLHGDNDPDFVGALGIKSYRPPFEPNIGNVRSGWPAEVAGLKAGDRIIAINDVPVHSWETLEEIIRHSPNKKLKITFERDSVAQKLNVVPRSKTLASGDVIGLIGIEPKDQWPAELKREIQYSVISGWIPAFDKVQALSFLTLESIYKLITGQMSLTNLRGIGTVTVAAGASAEGGVQSFLSFLALLSVSLGVLNLLPIPVLDGGHLLYCVIELIIRRPVPERVQIIGVQIGIMIILVVMGLALYNDVLRFWPE